LQPDNLCPAVSSRLAQWRHPPLLFEGGIPTSIVNNAAKSVYKNAKLLKCLEPVADENVAESLLIDVNSVKKIYIYAGLSLVGALIVLAVEMVYSFVENYGVKRLINDVVESVCRGVNYVRAAVGLVISCTISYFHRLMLRLSDWVKVLFTRRRVYPAFVQRNNHVH